MLNRMRAMGIRCLYNFRQQTAHQLEKETDALIADVKVAYDSVGSVKASDVSFATVIKRLLDIDQDRETRGAALVIPSMVAVDKAVRDASTVAEKRLDELHVEMTMRKDVFDNIMAFSKSEEMSSLEPELKRYVDKLVVDGKRNGLHLPEETREVIKTVKKRMSELGVSFQKNLNEDTTHLFFEKKELDGVPEDLLKTLDRDESDRLKVTMQYPHFFPVTRKCRVPKTRHLMEKTFLRRCIEENTPILEELVELRQKHADLLGYKNHATYITELRMAKNPETVATFLSELAEKLKLLAKEEMEVMLKLKEEETKELGLEFNGKLDYWDIRYYSTMVEEKLYSVDQEKLKEYFPMEVVTNGMMEIYQRLLGLKFNKVTGEVWHDDVEMWQVDDAKTGENLGYFLLDLYPREGKFGHACKVTLQQGCLDPTGERQKSVAAMLCNFAKYTAERPSLLDHREVQTYFHEFGHVMHHICSRVTTSRFFGTAVERDFVEAPSQMLENWVWQEESLRLMSKHYKDGSALPKELLDKLVASRNANAGCLNLRQIFLSTFDQRLHTRAKADTAALVAETYREIVGVEPIPDTNFAASFGHLVGYDGQYYGYMWSEVYSQDMFDSRFAAEGILNPDTGADYRRCILEKGGSMDGMDMLKEFLGREPSQEAFLKSKGLHQA